MKLIVDTRKYDGVTQDAGYDNADTDNDGRGMFEAGWIPGDPFPATPGLGRNYVKGMGNAFTRSNAGLFGLGDTEYIAMESPDGSTYYKDGYGNIIGATDPNGNFIPVSDPGPSDIAAPDTSSPPAPANINPADWINLLAQSVPKIIAGMNAYQLSQLQMDRARRGLPPLNAALYGPQMGVGLTPETSKMLLFGALGIGALLMLTKK